MYIRLIQFKSLALLLRYEEIINLAPEINLPASKSISNRALIIQALSEVHIPLNNLSKASDTEILINVIKENSLSKNIGIAGTAARFLCAYLATKKSDSILDGDQRMRERPMNTLFYALSQLGAKIEFVDKAGFLPVKINGEHIQGGEINIDSSVSSQFVSALMLIAPRLNKGLKITLDGTISSSKYIEMTKHILGYFNIDVYLDKSHIIIPHQEFTAIPLTIESDWSSASYFYSALALVEQGEIVLKNLNFDSWQGDEIIADIFYRLGIRSSMQGDDVRLEKTGHMVDNLVYDFIECPDLAQTVICTCVGLGIEGEFKGLHTLVHKETNRIKALQNELQKLKWILEESSTGIFNLRRDHSAKELNLNIHTYNDHRMAMAFAPLAIIYDKLSIDHAEVVNKSFPSFWEEFSKLGLS